MQLYSPCGSYWTHIFMLNERKWDIHMLKPCLSATSMSSKINACAHTHMSILYAPNLLHIDLILGLRWDFIKIFVNRSLKMPKLVPMSLDLIFFLKKNDSPSQYIRSSHKNGFHAICNTTWLLHISVIGLLFSNWHSLSNYFNQWAHMLLMLWPDILPHHWILQVHFVSYFSKISCFLRQVHSTQKWIVY